jgi:hypothetical protein
MSDLRVTPSCLGQMSPSCYWYLVQTAFRAPSSNPAFMHHAVQACLNKVWRTGTRDLRSHTGHTSPM